MVALSLYVIIKRLEMSDTSNAKCALLEISHCIALMYWWALQLYVFLCNMYVRFYITYSESAFS